MVNKKEYVVERKIHDSIYLINTKQNYLNDKCCLYEINEMASYIWNQIDGNTSIDEIVNRLFYDMEIQGASFDEVKKDINDCVCLLANEGFLEVEKNGRN